LDEHHLPLLADQVALHRAGRNVVRAKVTEFAYIKVAAKLPVNAMQQIQIELPSHSFGIVVGTQQQINVLFHIKSDQHDVVMIEGIPQASQKKAGTIVIEVSNGRP